MHSVVKKENLWFSKYSSLPKLIGVTACVICFCDNLKEKVAKIRGPSSVLEREAAMLKLIKMMQKNHFSK